MTHIFVANPKGGCGKTTIAVQLAAYFSLHDTSVTLVDHDVQKSCSDWLTSRSMKQGNITLQTTNAVYEEEGNNGIFIHDFPAAAFIEQSPELFHPGDKIIIPVLPSPTDIRSCLRFIMALHRSGLPDREVEIGLVANRVRSNTHYASVIHEFLIRTNVPLITTLRDAQAYVRTMEDGKSIFDLPASRAKKDLVDWQPLIDWVTGGDSKASKTGCEQTVTQDCKLEMSI